METIDDTGIRGIRLIQDTAGFRYGTDALLLADFAQVCCPEAREIVDLGCGNGIISLLLASEHPQRRVRGIEVQAEASALAIRSAALNGLSQQTEFLCCDIKDLQEEHPQLRGSSQLVVSNPPYVARGSGILSKQSALLTARQETTADLQAFVEKAAWLLQDKGSLCMVHRPSRLVDIFWYCRESRLEPKRIRFVHPRQGQPPNIVLVQAVRNGGCELKYDNPIYVH